MIKLQKLNKHYGELHAVRDLDLEVKEGELFCFLGPNGAGKTTTIKMMTGLVRPDSGEIELAGINALTHPIDAKRGLGYIPDTAFVYERLTPMEFAEFTGDLYRIPRPQVRKEMNRLIEVFGLGAHRNSLIKHLSHGLKQRVIYACTLLHDPRILLVDEPFIGLDPFSIRLIKDLLRTRSRELGMTIFMTTHILAIAEEIADRIAIIDNGRIVACGTLDELRRNTQSGSGSGRLEDLFLQLTLNPELAQAAPHDPLARTAD